MYEQITFEMVRYLGINYLHEAVASRRQLLSRCLMTVPKSQDLQADGKLKDDRYRLPWTRVKPEKEFLANEAGYSVAAADVLVQLSETSCLKTENFSNDPYIDFDVVPSSNPNSPDTYCLDKTLSIWLATPDIFMDAYEKENLKQYHTGNDDLQIDMLSGEDYLSETLRKLPSVSTLKDRLRPVQVKDPLTQDINKYQTEDLRFSEDQVTPVLDQQYDGKLFQETFESQFLACQKKTKDELEDVVSPPSSQDIADGTEEATRLSKNIVLKQEIQVDKESSVVHLIQNKLCPQENSIKPEALYYSPISSGKPSFLEINEIVVTEEDKFCERSFLQVPADESIERDLKIPKLQIPKVDLISVADTPQEICILTEKEKQLLTDKIFASERFCDEMQASRLPEPAENIEETFSKDEACLTDNPINKAKDTLDITPCRDLGQTELSLAWDIVKYGSGVADTSKILNKLAVDGDCDIALKTVEMIEKYSVADLYDWKDPMISMEKPSVPDKVIGESYQDKNKIQNQSKQLDAKMKNSEVLKPPVILPAVGNDPLEDFMALRKNMFTASARQSAVSEISSTETREPCTEEPDCNIKPSVKELRPVIQGRKKIKHHIVSVKLSDAFQQVLDLLSEKASYMIQALKLSGDVSQSCSFEILTPDMTRFLLKQKEKQIQDDNEDVDETYRNIVGLHALSGAADIIAHCGLESGIAHISAIQEKYSDTLKGILTDIRQKLFEMKAMFFKKQLYHPKVVTLCKEIETWLKKKRVKSGDNEQKILVLVRRDLPSLLKSLKTVLTLGHLLIPEILASSTSEDIIKSLDEHNCLLVYTGLVNDHFPWAQFCLVVEYEYQSDSVWKDHCERQNIRHIALKLDMDNQPDPSTDSAWSTSNPGKQITLIASQNITKNIELLQVLEARHNILLVERDYSLIEGCRQLHFPDVDVDEGCGIVLIPLADLKDDCTVQALVTRILALSLKLRSCWILLYSDRPSCYEFPGVIVSNMSRLEATIANLSNKKEDLEIKLLTCSDLAEVSGSIRSISENYMKTNKSRDAEEWLSRDWLSEEVSQGEKFLMMMPSITSFNAQLMLKTLSLKQLLNCELLDLSFFFPWVPEKVLKQFLAVSNNVYGLHLQDDKPVQESTNPAHVDSDTEKPDRSSSLSDVLDVADAAANRTIEMEDDNSQLLYRQNQEACAYKDTFNTKQASLNPVETRQLEGGNNNSVKKYPCSDIQCEDNNKVNQTQETQEVVHHFSSAEVPQMRRYSRLHSAPSNKTNKEDWLLLDNFIKDKHDSTESLKNNSFLSCKDEGQKIESVLPRNNKDLTHTLPKHVVRTRPQAEVSREIVTETEQDILSLHNRQIMAEYQQQNANINNYGAVQKQDSKTGYDFGRNRNYLLNQSIGNRFGSGFPLYQRNSDDLYESKIDSQGLNCIIENIILNRDRMDVGINHNNMTGYSRAEIERFVDEDLENFVNNRFAHSDKVTMPESTKNVSIAGDSFQKHDNVDETVYYNSDQGIDMFQGKESNRRSIPRLPFSSLYGMDEKDPLLLQIPCQISSEKTLFFNSNKSESETLQNHQSDHIGMKGRPSEMNMNLGAELDDRGKINRSKYFDIEVDHRNKLRTVRNRTSFPHAFRTGFNEPVGMFRETEENFRSRPHLQPNTFDLDKVTVQKGISGKDSSVEWNYLNHTVSDSKGLMHPKTVDISQSRKSTFVFEPVIETLMSNDTSIKRKGTCNQNSVTAADGREQFLTDLQHPINNIKLVDKAEAMHDGNLFINPQIERVSRPPKFVDVQLTTEQMERRSLEDDLRETTRKLLANSQQFSRFSSASSRRPMQKLNIGLAVPLHRDKTPRNVSVHSNDTNEFTQERNSHGQPNTMISRQKISARNDPGKLTDPLQSQNQQTVLDSNTTQSRVPSNLSRQRAVQEQKILMEQSPWATSDSPPMDLDYGDELTQREKISSNRAVFTSQTPQKKRKLTYQAVPGRKGQTKLVFQ